MRGLTRCVQIGDLTALQSLYLNGNGLQVQEFSRSSKPRSEAAVDLGSD